MEKHWGVQEGGLSKQVLHGFCVFVLRDQLVRMENQDDLEQEDQEDSLVKQVVRARLEPL